MKKHETFQNDLESYRSKIDELVTDSSSMLAAGHYDSTAIKDKQVLVRTYAASLVVYLQNYVYIN